MAHYPHTFVNRWISFIRFLNLLEPGSEVLSISKVLMWTMTITFIHYAWNNSTNMAGLIATFSALSVAFANYAFRRHLQYKNGKGPYPTEEAPVAQPDPAPATETPASIAHEPQTSAFPQAPQEG